MSKKKQKAKSNQEKTTALAVQGKLSLVIPCFNESSRVAKLMETLAVFDRSWSAAYELILVDDGSSDDTTLLLKKALDAGQLGKAQSQVITLPQNVGKGGALQAGVAAAKGDFILTLDADMATDPMELKNWLAELPNGQFDPDKILIGSRENEDSKVKGQLLRRFAGLVYNFIIQLFTNLPFADTQCGFKLYPAKIGHSLFAALKSKGWSHDVELLYNASLQGIPIQPMPIAWEHQDDSKISLVRDSIRMFADTMIIAFRLNWNWMIGQPIRDIRQKVYDQADPSFYRLLFVLLTLLTLFGMPFLSGDYGITADEHFQKKYGELVLAYFESNRSDQSALEYENLYYYGGLFDYLAAWTSKYICSWDIYDIRHFLNSLFGFLMIFFTGLLARELGRSWRMAFFASLFMVLSPRIFGHSMNNPKDIPFAAAYAFTLLYLLRYFRHLPKPGMKTMACLILGIAWAINVRVGGILLIAYLAIIPVLRYFIPFQGEKPFTRFSQLLKFSGQALIVAILGYWGGLQFWPYGLEAPFTNPVEALQEMSNFSTSIRMLFEGSHLWSDELPWYYIPKWFLISAPLFLLVGLGFFVSLLILYWRKLPVFLLLILTFTALFPVGYAVFNGSSLYDGMRHFLFVFPGLVVLAAYGWHRVLSLPGSKIQTWSIRLILALLILLPAQWMYRNHPHQYVYFNEISGATNNAFARYEMDYWMNSVKGLCQWVIDEVEPKASGEKVVLVTNCVNPATDYLKEKAPHVKVVYARYFDRHRFPADYYLFIPRFIDRNLLIQEVWPPKAVVYTEYLDGIPLGTVSKRESFLDYEGQQAIEAGDYTEAIDLFQKAIALDPKNDAALLGLTDAAMRADSSEIMFVAAEELVHLSDTYINGLFALGVNLYNAEEFGGAYSVFERIRELNYKFSAAYYYLATLYAGQRKLEEAVELMEIYDRENGNLPKAYQLAIQLTKTTGQTYKEYYFRAKLAYIEKDMKRSVDMIKKSTALNPNYEPAQQMYRAYEKVLK